MARVKVTLDVFESKWVTVTLCTWETSAILSNGKIPTITKVHRDHPWFGAVLWGFLGWHFWTTKRGKDT